MSVWVEPRPHTHTERALRFKSTRDARCVASDTVSSDNSVFPAELCSIFKLVSQIVQPSMGLDPRTVQLTASRCTDYAVLSCKMILICLKNVLYWATKTVKCIKFRTQWLQALMIHKKCLSRRKGCLRCRNSLHFQRRLRTKFLAVYYQSISLVPTHKHEFWCKSVESKKRIFQFFDILLTAHLNTRAVRKVSRYFEYLKNRSRGLDATWQPVREDLIVCLWTVTLPWG